jgi:hypothetical protein
MPTETPKTTAEKLVAHCRAHAEMQGLDELYDPAQESSDILSNPRGALPTVQVQEAQRAKSSW